MKTAILGSGVYGLAISNVLINSGCDVNMWTEQKDFKNISVKEEVHLTNSFLEAVQDAEVIFVLTGSTFVSSVLKGIEPYVDPSSLIVLGSKGILADGTLMTDLAESILPNNHYAVISGPTFAADIAALEPVGFTIGTSDDQDFAKIKKCLKTVFLEHSKDTIAIEMAGSLKNAYAIGSGILAGLGYGTSTNCLYMTKVLNEMGHIFEAMGSSKESCTTLAGVGDLVLTCSSPNSRNFTFGTILASNSEKEKQDYLDINTVEGYENLKSYVAMLEHKKILAPIMNCVHSVVSETSDPKELIELLLK